MRMSYTNPPSPLNLPTAVNARSFQSSTMAFVPPTTLPTRCSKIVKRKTAGSCSLRASATKPDAETTGTASRIDHPKLKPEWAGDTPLSRLVNAFVATPFLYSLIKQSVRRKLIHTAEKKGIPWRQRTAELSELIPASDRDQMLDSIRDPHLEYPDYYLNPFHAYVDGNLGWLQAFEAGSATKIINVRTFRSEPELPEQQDAFERMHAAWFAAVLESAPGAWLDRPAFSALDVGCGVGISTRDLARRLLAHGVDVKTVEGIDASPYFLAVAAVDSSPCGPDRTGVDHLVSFRHALAERTKVLDESLDFVSMHYTAHELPTSATRSVLEEAFRVLKPNSVFTLLDNDPKSPVVQNAPFVLITLMKSTEPFLDQYYSLNMEALLEDIGFVNIKYTRTDPRHCTIVATKPWLSVAPWLPGIVCQPRWNVWKPIIGFGRRGLR